MSVTHFYYELLSTSCYLVVVGSEDPVVYFLVGAFSPSEKIVGMIIANIWGKKRSSKSPTRSASAIDRVFPYIFPMISHDFSMIFFVISPLVLLMFTSVDRLA